MVFRASSMVLGLFFAAIALPACSKAEAPPPSSTTAAAPGDAPAKAAAAGPKVDTETYRVEMSKGAAACKVGAPCDVVVSIAPKAGYHINKEYPYKLKLADAPDGVAFAKSTYAREDGKFEEKRGAFDVAFTPSKAGKKDIKGTLSFSVCSDANCVMDKAELELPVDVE